MSTITTKAFGTKHAKGNLEPITIERRAPLDNDVAIKILYCGVCHTDLHQVNEDWEKNKYPLVPGHEIIGEVLSVGPKVSKFKVGDKVGVGFVAESCKSCKACHQNLEQHCKEMTSVCADTDKHFKSQQTFGGYSEMIVIDQDYVVSIPTGLDLAAAAPLLCAGITVYSPLSRYEVKKGTKVGVVGLGGLGHMGVKFALVMGAEVTVITQSADKEEVALGLGAHKVINSEDAHQMEAYNDYFDMVLNTIPYAHDLSPFIKCVGPCGVLACVGLVGKVSEKLDTTLLVFRGKSLTGSMCGGIKETQEMLDFSAKHGIVANVEKINIREVNDVYKRMLKSDVDHRYVIDMSTI